MSWTNGTAYGLSSGPETYWHERAACRYADPEIFFYDGLSLMDLRMQAAAKRFCVGCQVRPECAEFGATQSFGIWGGRTPRERRGLPVPVLRSCSRCREQFVMDLEHPHARLCHDCDKRREPADAAVQPVPVPHFNPATHVNASKTHCKRNHEFTPGNTRINQGKRVCVQCAADRGAAERARKAVSHA